MRTHVEKFVKHFCASVDLEDPERTVHGGPFEVDGIVFSIIYNEHINNSMMFLYVDFGYAPSKNEATVYYELLKQNYITFAGKGPAYTISPITGSVIYIEHFFLDQITPAEFVGILAHLSARAKEWQKTFFLDAS